VSELFHDKTNRKKIFSIAIPIIFQQLFYQMQLYIDQALLGHLNPEYFSAIGNARVPFFTATSLITALCGGTTILVAQRFGAKDELQTKRFAESSFIGNSLLSIILLAIFFFFAEAPLTLMGVQSPILEYSTKYIKIISFSFLILGAETTSQCILQGLGTTKVIMIAGIAGNALNIFLDWVLIYGRLGFPQLTIEGAAYATTLSNFIAGSITILYLFISKNIPLRMKMKKLRIKWLSYKNVLRLGIPLAFESLLWNFGNIIIMYYLNLMDIMSAGIYTLLFSIELFPYFYIWVFRNPL